MSELLNALNPHIANGRARRAPQQRPERAPPPQVLEPPAAAMGQLQTSPRPSPRLPPQQPRHNGSYSSELELAMVAQPPPAPRYAHNLSRVLNTDKV